MDVYQYTKRIQECAKTGNMSGAVHLFNVMKEEGVWPDNITYNVMMNGFSKLNNADKVIQLFDEMQKSGIKPNLYVFNTAIRACAIDVDLERAAHLFGTMQQRYSLKPDNKTYGSLIHVCAVAGQLPLAKKCFARMQKDGVAGNVVVYSSLIDAYAEATDEQKGPRHFKECKLLLESMKEKQIMPDNRTYDALIKVCVRGQLMQEALNCFLEMKSTGPQPSLFTFSLLFDGLAKIPTIPHEEVKAMMNKLLDEMTKRQLKPDLQVYTPLLNLCCKLKDLGRAKGFFQSLKMSGLKPNVICYGAIMKCYEKLGDASNKQEYLKRVFSLLEEMQVSRMSLNVGLFTSLISACANACDIKRALQIWTLAGSQGVVPDSAIFGAMIKVFLRANDLQGAFLYLRQMESAGIERDQVICYMFLRFFASHRMKEHAEQFLKEMTALNFPQSDSIRQQLKSLGLV